MSTINVALVQADLHWEQPDLNRKLLQGYIQAAQPEDIVVLPEMFTTGFSMRSAALAETIQGDTLKWMALQAESLNVVLCGSLIINDQDQFYNRFVWMPPDGKMMFYDKRHLFRMSEENDHYSAGTDRLLVDYQDARICPLVCYDLRFPVFSRNNESYALAIYVANWPAVRSPHWTTLLKARAIENQSFIVGVNRIGRDGNNVDYCGDSMVIDFQGNTLLDMGETPGLKRVTLDLASLAAYRSAFPAWKDNDAFIIS
ncbi:MAG: amidohydrolase [Gammaproteobacteria bacterium]|jgi:omega-amidase|nr:amidohydrolase [Gammaproteobacteria bacterium]